MTEQSSAPAVLEIEEIRVQFGGLVAVDTVSLRAEPGCITGLIGPNGAGKTTTFNACTGLVRPQHGSVRLDGKSLDRKSPSRRAQAGLGRTFQQMELCETMSVRDNVAIGHEAREAGRRMFGQLRASRNERSRSEAVADSALEQCGISHLAASEAGDLSTGQQRLVEIARAIAGRFRFLLLDEPSSGLDEAETQAFGAVLRDVIARDGIGILLVEHDMSLVRNICEYIYVLDFGKLIFGGPTADALSADIVRAAYLGSEEVA